MIYIFGWAFDPLHVGHTAIVKSILAKKHPEKIIIIPSSERDDKQYHVSDEHRLAMLAIFVWEINDSLPSVTLKNKESAPLEMEQIPRSSEWQKSKVIIDDHFIQNWSWEMITRDVDLYAREKYGDDVVHIFGTDTIVSMPDWDSDGYAAKRVKKIFIPRNLDRIRHPNIGRIQASRNSEYGSFVPQDDGKIENFEFFTDCHIPDISSTELREVIPDYTGLKAYFEENPKFIIPGLSKRISQYILEQRLYRIPSLQRGMPEGQGDFAPEWSQKNPQSLRASSFSKEPMKPKILVHVCCGPDATMPILQLRDEYEVICFWYDPNIQPKSEYDKRYDAFVKICEIENIPYIKWAYDVDHFFTRIRWVEYTPERWEKCTYCYDMRMMVSAKLAARLHIPLYTSSLNTSPKKDLEKLFTMGHKYAEKYGIEFLDIPFRKKWGFERSVEYTKEHDIYRQNYCGCIYSIREGGDSDMKRRIVG